MSLMAGFPRSTAQCLGMKSNRRLRSLLPLICFVQLFGSAAFCQDKAAPEWQARDLTFRALNATGNSSSIWVCGTDETVAVSNDAGEHWQVKHSKPDGAVLLNIAFANEKFGYAG